MFPDDIFSNLYPADMFDDETYDNVETLDVSSPSRSPDDDLFPANTPLAMAYVPMQRFQKLYNPDKAFDVGTLYEELDKPWLGRRAFSE